MPYKRHAQAQYRLFSWGLSVLSPVKPFFRLALRVLTRKRHQVRGHILPVNAPLGRPEQVPLGRDILVRLIGRSTAIAAMNECLCRSVGLCTDYPVDLGCLVLGDAVKNLHPGLGRQVGRDEALSIVDRALALRLTPLVIHFKSDALLWSLEHRRMLTVCFCCPCHCLLRGVLGKKPAHITGLPGVSILRDASKCVGCGRCTNACISGALEIEPGRISIDEEKCMVCGRCAMACAYGALTVDTLDGQRDMEPVVSEYRGRTSKNSVFLG